MQRPLLMKEYIELRFFSLDKYHFSACNDGGNTWFIGVAVLFGPKFGLIGVEKMAPMRRGLKMGPKMFNFFCSIGFDL